MAKKKLFIKTYGCQMNVTDTDIVRAVLLDHGFQEFVPPTMDAFQRKDQPHKVEEVVVQKHHHKANHNIDKQSKPYLLLKQTAPKTAFE